MRFFDSRTGFLSKKRLHLLIRNRIQFHDFILPFSIISAVFLHKTKNATFFDFKGFPFIKSAITTAEYIRKP